MQRTEFWASMSELASRVAAGISLFIDREIELAKLEASEDLDALANATRLFGAAVVLAIGVAALLLTAAVSGLTALYLWLGVGENLATALAALSVALILALLVWWLVAHASAILRKLGKRIDRALTVFGHESRPHALPPLDPERDDRSLD
jgi:hypothetical protein